MQKSVQPDMDKKRNCGLGIVALSTIVVACLALGYVEYIDVPKPLINTNNGIVGGKYVTVDGKFVSEFLGIPYAEPPVGKLRFQNSKPVNYWSGVMDAISKPPPCVQAGPQRLPWVTNVTSNEDCLYLSIWVPGQCTNIASKSVMVFIHGGGYYSGWSGEDLYDGSVLAATEDVVVVTLNYRLGSLGFFDSGTEEAPGNMGMLDQVLAMQWIKRNIQNFGGDPDSITLFGESAGSISVGLHIISPMANMLFDKAIMQSGSPYHPQVASSVPVSMFKSNVFATMLGCADNSSNLFTKPREVVDCMKKISPAVLSQVESAILENLPYFFLPTYGNDYMPRSPMEAMDAGKFKKMPLLIGNNKDEGAVFLHHLLPNYFGREVAVDLNKALATMVILGLFQNSTNPMPNVVSDFYLKDVIDDDYEDIRKKIHGSFGDFIFVCPTAFYAEKFGNVYYYFFTHRPSNSQWGEWMGATHFEELPFVFGLPKVMPTSYTQDEVKLSEDIMHSWSQFAKFGDPSAMAEREWPKYTKEQPEYKVLNTEEESTQLGPHTEQCNFWRTYFK